MGVVLIRFHAYMPHHIKDVYKALNHKGKGEMFLESCVFIFFFLLPSFLVFFDSEEEKKEGRERRGGWRGI